MEVKIVVMKCKYSGSWQYPPLRAEPLRAFSVNAEICEVWIAYFDGIIELQASGLIVSNDAEFDASTEVDIAFWWSDAVTEFGVWKCEYLVCSLSLNHYHLHKKH